MNGRLRGIALTATGVMVLSPDSLLVRLLGANLSTTLFWRGLAMAVGLFGYILIRDRGHPAAMLGQLRHPLGWGLGLLFALCNVLFVTALSGTSVADTLGCLATASMFAALFSVLFLGERAPLRTWIASAVIAAGLLLIAVDGAGTGFGRAIGVLTAAMFGAMLVLMRASGEGDTLPGLALGGAIIAVLSVGPATPLALSLQGFGAVAGLAIVLPLSFALIGHGPRYLPAAEVSLLMLLETVFGTLWAWLFLGEPPNAATLLAMALILATLAAFYARQAQLARTASPKP